jgi:hypothetical protein
MTSREPPRDRCSKSLPLLRALGVVLLSLAATSAWARPAAVVGWVEDPRGKAAAQKARAVLIRALQRAKEVDVLPLPRVISLARAAGVRASALRRNDALVRFSVQAGADGVVKPVVKRSGRELRMRLAVLDREGHEISSNEIALSRGELTRAQAARMAASIGSALASHLSGSEPAPPAQVQAQDPAPTQDASRLAAAPPPPPVEPSIALSDSAPLREAPREPQDPVPEVARPSRPEESSAGPSPRRGPGYVSLNVAYSMTWRTYRICPEVERCDQSPPLSAGASSRYTTDKPYGGIVVRADLFPLNGVGGFARGIGLGGGFGQSLQLATHYTDSRSTDQQFGSYQQRFWGELGYRLTFSLDGAGEGWVEARGGYLFHLFAVEPNPKSVVESRRNGLYGALAALFPLHRYAALDARFALVPSASPGAQERAVYGANASGVGLNLTAGLSSDFGHPEWHVRAQALFELVYFDDHFTDNSGKLPSFARGEETYYGALFGVQGSL